jgi:hypothetical protein
LQNPSATLIQDFIAHVPHSNPDPNPDPLTRTPAKAKAKHETPTDKPTPPYKHRSKISAPHSADPNIISMLNSQSAFCFFHITSHLFPLTSPCSPYIPTLYSCTFSSPSILSHSLITSPFSITNQTKREITTYEQQPSPKPPHSPTPQQQPPTVPNYSNDIPSAALTFVPNILHRFLFLILGASGGRFLGLVCWVLCSSGNLSGNASVVGMRSGSVGGMAFLFGVCVDKWDRGAGT